MAGRVRVAAYVLLVEDRRLLMCRIAGPEPAAGRWTLPGGGVRFGEEPGAAAMREVEEETGLLVALDGVAAVTSAVMPARPPERLEPVHAVGILYRGRVVGGELRPEPDGSTDQAAWIDETRSEGLPVVPVGAAAIRLAFGDPGLSRAPEGSARQGEPGPQA
ncbi:MAG TPA: NUDIX domain-containing protein [Candidatus Dormibacteraeota bacterium]|nr:NUDIX domain-containing protein [Candidatus Dormibacteraeota bacterium]